MFHLISDTRIFLISATSPSPTFVSSGSTRRRCHRRRRNSSQTLVVTCQRRPLEIDGHVVRLAAQVWAVVQLAAARRCALRRSRSSELVDVGSSGSTRWRGSDAREIRHVRRGPAVSRGAHHAHDAAALGPGRVLLCRVLLSARLLPVHRCRPVDRGSAAVVSAHRATRRPVVPADHRQHLRDHARHGHFSTIVGLLIAAGIGLQGLIGANLARIRDDSFVVPLTMVGAGMALGVAMLVTAYRRASSR